MILSNSPASSSSSRLAASSRTMSGGNLDIVVDDFSSDNREISTASNDVIGIETPAIGQTPLSEESQARRRGRKGHTKSRTGCHNCKKARIKCKENRPSCDYCTHRALKCEWPGLQVSQASQTGTLIRKPTPNLIPATIHTQGPVFTMQDFRLFNHFVQTAYPHHPPLNDSVWTHEIPSIASDYDFLLHSMLALSASDIAASNPSPASPELRYVAMSHRVKAISSLNEAIGKPIQSVEQGNAMIATCFSLLFQSTLIDDGVVEYMTFVRGVLVVSLHMSKRNIRFLFDHMFDQAQVVEPELTGSPLINPDHARRACRSLELFCPVVQNTREVEFYGHLLSAARALFTSSRAAYSHLAKIYSLFSYFMSHEEFELFINSSNEAGKLLRSHFAALQLIMTPFTRRETPGRKFFRKNSTGPDRTDGTTNRWLVALHRDIKPEMVRYYEWPIWVQNAVSTGELQMKFDEEPILSSDRQDSPDSWTIVVDELVAVSRPTA